MSYVVQYSSAHYLFYQPVLRCHSFSLKKKTVPTLRAATCLRARFLASPSAASWSPADCDRLVIRKVES